MSNSVLGVEISKGKEGKERVDLEGLRRVTLKGCAGNGSAPLCIYLKDIQ